jgi:hypothetical protein
MLWYFGIFYFVLVHCVKINLATLAPAVALAVEMSLLFGSTANLLQLPGHANDLVLQMWPKWGHGGSPSSDSQSTPAVTHMHWLIMRFCHLL